MAETVGEFFDLIRNGAEPSFRSEPWYNKDGDSIHYHWVPTEFYAERVDDKLTLYRSFDSNEIVGCEIKGITALLEKFGNFGLHVNEDGIPLAIFIVYSHVTASAPTGQDLQRRQETYLYLLEKAGKNRIEFHAVGT